MQQPKPNVSSVLSHPSLDQAGTGQAAASDARADNQVESIELLRGGKSISIRHNGSLYRLQTTKLGKLILTK
ncbi:hemin uptake protein HemP [Variovorax sp. RHLX14]|uniref:hemin uptake protein HemP n=1 Tax=Variovorax sp. RHLX14 TaxID=1259731 RepID=UPI003F44DFFD